MTARWIPLQDVDDAARCGQKAATLAVLARAGHAVLPGWVLPADADEDDTGRALLDLHATRQWILRSTSPHEDRPDASAAGVFLSVTAAAVPEDLERAIERVRARGDDPRVKDVLGLRSAHVAVLAQPHRDFARWCTVESTEDDVVLEGWRFEADGPKRWSESDPDVVAACRAAAVTLDLTRALFEVGVDDDGLWILQARPAPSRRLRAASTAVEVPDPVGLGARVGPGDEDVAWVWDHAHSPLPLCPLLATTFGRWIAASGGRYPSRLIDGRWHDRPRSGADDPIDDATLAEGLDAWDDAMARVRNAVPSLENAVARIDGTRATWTRFLEGWLDAQTVYFSTPSGRLRRWVTALEETRGVRVGVAPGATIAARRAEVWHDLAQQLDATSPRELDAWWQAQPQDPLARRLEEAHRDASHLCALPYDGRGVPWGEDRDAFLRAIVRHRHRHDRDVAPADVPERARAIVERAEDDDDLLLQLYALWRRAVLRLADAATIDVDDVLDLPADDLDAWTETNDRASLVEAVRRGRALAAHWSSRRPRVEGAATGVLHGRPAAPGRVEGPIARAVHLGELGDPAPGTIAVVESVLPSDAVLVPFLGGLVCESGDVLGHASILAREAGIPCVVDVADARIALARQSSVVVDGDSGTVVGT